MDARSVSMNGGGGAWEEEATCLIRGMEKQVGFAAEVVMDPKQKDLDRDALRHGSEGAKEAAMTTVTSDGNAIRRRRNGSSKQKWELVHFRDVPKYLKDNEYITRGYRADYSIWDCLVSVFHIHNETLNIWTHLGGFLLFLSLTISMAAFEWEPHNITVHWPFYVFLVGAMICLLCSAVCHVFTCVSDALSAIIWRCDYAGIAVMITTSFFPPVYYGFLCNRTEQIFYLVSTTVFGLITLCLSLLNFFQAVEWRPMRALSFAILGLWGIVPCVHAISMHLDEPSMRTTVLLEVLMGAIYLGGAGVYTLRIPERWKPGWFDIAGHSHQIFHVAVVVAAYVHYHASLVLLQWRDTHVGCGIP